MSLPAGNHSGGNTSAFADGSVRFISTAAAASDIRAAATKDGREPVNLP
jgi:prepilin-type processing-associated H-X9-DG protein